MNEFISLKLENGETNIYVNGKRTYMCKYLLISIPYYEVDQFDHYATMDEIIKASGGETGAKATKLDPIEEFHGHCSNIQAWVENGYDTKILDTRLSIPIIKRILVHLSECYSNLPEHKAFYKAEFRRFFFDVVESLDDYLKSRLENEYTFGHFEFLYKILFRTKDIFFEKSEIAGSYVLKKVYQRFQARKNREIMIRKRSYWERKLWKREPVVKRDGHFFVGDKEFYYEFKAEKYSKRKNLEYRRYLRSFRDAVDEASRYYITKSDRRDYLPYLYSMGKFTDEKNISFLQIDKDTFIRDSNGHYWKCF